MIYERIFKGRGNKKRVAHIMAAVVILSHSLEKYDSGHQSYILFGIAGLIFLTIAILHPVIEKKAPWIDGVFFIIEGILSIIVAIDFFHMGKKAIPYLYLLAACFQFFVAFRKSKKGWKEHNEQTLVSESPTNS